MKAKRPKSEAKARVEGLRTGYLIAKHEQSDHATRNHYQPYDRGPEATAWLAGFEQGYLSGWDGNYCPDELNQDPIDYEGSDRYID